MTKKPVQISGYRVDRWINKATNETLYGVSVRIVATRGWVRVCEDSKAIILDTKSQADSYISQMKSERDAQGFKLPPPPEPTCYGGQVVHRDPCENCGDRRPTKVANG